MRPVPCQQEGDKLPKGPYQSGNRYLTGVHLPGHLACDPSSQREASHVSSQGKEAIFVTHDIYKTKYAFAKCCTSWTILHDTYIFDISAKIENITLF